MINENRLPVTIFAIIVFALILLAYNLGRMGEREAIVLALSIGISMIIIAAITLLLMKV